MPIASTTQAPANIAKAITKASKSTGVDFDFLLNMAERESSFKPGAKASSSSATGLFQFIEQTWLRMVKQNGAQFGLSEVSGHISKNKAGEYFVKDEAQRDKILKLRENAEISALMAGAYTHENNKILSSKIGRAPSHGELYMAHFLGPNAAVKLINLTQTAPTSPADKYFPEAAKANKNIFYANNNPKTVRDLYQDLTTLSVRGNVPALNEWKTHISTAAVNGQINPNKNFLGVNNAANVTSAATNAQPSQAPVHQARNNGSVGAWGALVQNQPSSTALTSKNSKLQMSSSHFLDFRKAK